MVTFSLQPFFYRNLINRRIDHQPGNNNKCKKHASHGNGKILSSVSINRGVNRRASKVCSFFLSLAGCHNRCQFVSSTNFYVTIYVYLLFPLSIPFEIHSLVPKASNRGNSFLFVSRERIEIARGIFDLGILNVWIKTCRNFESILRSRYEFLSLT